MRGDAYIEPGTVVGNLTVLRKDKHPGENCTMYLCQCSCGSSPVRVSYSNLMHGRRTTCSAKCWTKHKDLTGRKFGHLTVLHRVATPVDKQGAHFLVQCDCGSPTKVIAGHALVHQHISSCGECDKLQPGSVFGKMEVISYQGNNAHGKRLYLFRCGFCGKESIHIGAQVVAGKTRSCGCQRGNQAKKHNAEARIRRGQSPDVPLTPLNVRLHHECADIRKYVLQRDDYTCQLCGARGVALEVHHIFPVIDRPDLTTDMQNMITLCSGDARGKRNRSLSCHGKAHAGNTKGPLDPEIQKRLLRIINKKYGIAESA